MLVYDGNDSATANALAVSYNHVVIGTNYYGRSGFSEGASGCYFHSPASAVTSLNMALAINARWRRSTGSVR